MKTVKNTEIINIEHLAKTPNKEEMSRQNADIFFLPFAQTVFEFDETSFGNLQTAVLILTAKGAPGVKLRFLKS